LEVGGTTGNVYALHDDGSGTKRIFLGNAGKGRFSNYPAPKKLPASVKPIAKKPTTEDYLASHPEGVEDPDGSEEDLEILDFEGVEVFVGAITGNIYIEHNGENVFVGNAGKGRFTAIKKPTN